MKSYRKELWLNIPSRRGFVNITPERAGWTYVGFRALRLATGETACVGLKADSCILVAP